MIATKRVAKWRDLGYLQQIVVPELHHLKTGEARRTMRDAVARQPLSVEAQLALISDMLDRLERQAAELGKLQARADALEAELAREREAHRRLAEELGRERAEVERLRAVETELEREREAGLRLVRELADARTANDRLESHLTSAWSEVQALRAELERPWWRRHRRRDAGRRAHRHEAGPRRP